ncbi:hypothetical protein ACK3TF_004323 [Chlorella vulgaris]
MPLHPPGGKRAVSTNDQRCAILAPAPLSLTPLHAVQLISTFSEPHSSSRWKHHSLRRCNILCSLQHSASTMAAALAVKSDMPRAGAQRRRPRRLSASVVCSSTARTVELDGGRAIVVAPHASSRCKGVVHFLGGAFVASVPHLTYSKLLERLADGGYTCIATPYAVTFQHIECARAVTEAFTGAVAQLRSGGGEAAGLGPWAVPADVPTHGVGHSNGSLLHLLAGSLPADAATGGSSAVGIGGNLAGSSRASNVLISFNNLQVTEAVPVPLGLLQPALQQLRGDGRLASAAQQGLQQAAATAQQLLALSAAAPWRTEAQQRQREQLVRSLQRWDPALAQLGSVFDEVGDGFVDFSPSPAEARRLVTSSYSVPSTLLVQFVDDSIDESPDAEAMLRGSGTYASYAPASTSTGTGTGNGNGNGRMQPSRAVRRLVLPGTHVTPCGADFVQQLPPGARFGPAEALAAAAASVLQADINRLADRALSRALPRTSTGGLTSGEKSAVARGYVPKTAAGDSEKQDAVQQLAEEKGVTLDKGLGANQ